MKLIPEARYAHRLASVQVTGILAALSLIQSDILPHLEPMVPAPWFGRITLGLAVAIVIARLWPQPALDEQEAQQEGDAK